MSLTTVLNNTIEKVGGEHPQRPFKGQPLSMRIEVSSVDDLLVEQLQRTKVRVKTVANEYGLGGDQCPYLRLDVGQRGGHPLQVALLDAAELGVVVEDDARRLHQRIVHYSALKVEQRHATERQTVVSVALERRW